jgi:hypothetical protein
MVAHAADGYGGPDLAWLLGHPVRWDTWVSGYGLGYEHGTTSGYETGFDEGYRAGADRGYRDGARQGRDDVRSGYARTQAARDALDALADFDARWSRRLTPEAQARAALVVPGAVLDVSDATRDRERLAVVLQALGIVEHRELARALRGAA